MISIVSILPRLLCVEVAQPMVADDNPGTLQFATPQKLIVKAPTVNLFLYEKDKNSDQKREKRG